MRSFSIGRVRRLRTTWACGLAAVGLALAAAPPAAAAPTVPGPPTITSVTPGVRSVKVTFAKPASDGGAPITGYRVKCRSNGGNNGAQLGTKSPIVVSGLTAEQAYRCTVAARNSVGVGPESAPSDSVRVKATTPGPPTITAATAGVRSVKVTFVKPADDGGARIGNYRVRCTSSNGGTTGATTAAKSPIVVTALSPGRTYTCKVAARNKLGLGTPSAPSGAVVPLRTA